MGRAAITLGAVTVQPTVADFMTADPIGADRELSLVDARQRMFLNNIRHLVVHNGSEVSGVLSTRDITLALSMARDPAKLTVADAAAFEPYTCSPETPLVDAVYEMEKHRYGCAIVTRGDELVGIFTTTDALRAVRALVTGTAVEPALKAAEGDAFENPSPAGRRIRLGRMRPIEGTIFLGHRIA